MEKKFLSFPFGEYEGDVFNGQPDGKGIFKYFDGGIYKGLWSKGKYNGKGKIIFTENTVSASDVSLEPGLWSLSNFGKNQIFLSSTP